MPYPLIQCLCSSQDLAFALPVDLQVALHPHDVLMVYYMHPWQVEGARRDVRQRPRRCRGRLLGSRVRRWRVFGCCSCFRLSCCSTAGPGGCWSCFRLSCCSTAEPGGCWSCFQLSCCSTAGPGGCWSCFRLNCCSTAGPYGCWSCFRLTCCSTAEPGGRVCCSLLCRCWRGRTGGSCL